MQNLAPGGLHGTACRRKLVSIATCACLGLFHKMVGLCRVFASWLAWRVLLALIVRAFGLQQHCSTPVCVLVRFPPPPPGVPVFVGPFLKKSCVL